MPVLPTLAVGCRRRTLPLFGVRFEHVGQSVAGISPGSQRRIPFLRLREGESGVERRAQRKLGNRLVLHESVGEHTGEWRLLIGVVERLRGARHVGVVGVSRIDLEVERLVDEQRFEPTVVLFAAADGHRAVKFGSHDGTIAPYTQLLVGCVLHFIASRVARKAVVLGDGVLLQVFTAERIDQRVGLGAAVDAEVIVLRKTGTEEFALPVVRGVVLKFLPENTGAVGGSVTIGVDTPLFAQGKT